jgi:hypothetical protein
MIQKRHTRFAPKKREILSPDRKEEARERLDKKIKSFAAFKDIFFFLSFDISMG